MTRGMIYRVDRALTPFAEVALGFSVSGGLGLADIHFLSASRDAGYV